MMLFRQIEIPTRSADHAGVPDGSARARLQPRRRGRERACLRPRAGDAGVAHGSDRRDESERRGRARPPPPLGTRAARRRTGRRRRSSCSSSRCSCTAVSAQQLANGPGYRTDHLLMMGFDPSSCATPTRSRSSSSQQVAERARAVPGVDDRHDDDVGADVERFDRRGDDRAGRVSVSCRKENAASLASSVDEHYFDAMGIALARGPRISRDRRRRERAARGHREPAVRAALLAEPGSGRQAVPP